MALVLRTIVALALRPVGLRRIGWRAPRRGDLLCATGRMKAAQACCQVALRLGSALPPHAGALMGALLRGASDGQPEVRASSLAALAQVAATLRFSLHPWAVDLLSVVGGKEA